MKFTDYVKKASDKQLDKNNKEQFRKLEKEAKRQKKEKVTDNVVEKYLTEGANGLTLFIKTTSENLFLKKFRQIVNDYASEYDDPEDMQYAGTWANVPGIRIIPLPAQFANRSITKKVEREIYDYLLKNADKWENALAVKTKKGYYVGAWSAS